MGFLRIKAKTKRTKKAKTRKRRMFANLKEREDSQWCNLPKLRKLHGARE
jgi:hypothetical protein